MSPDEADRLFDQAFKLERRGDRDAALAIYDDLAIQLAGEQNGVYAANCAAKLRDYEQLATGPPEPGIDGDYWSDNGILIVRHGAALPARCVKSNDQTRLKETYLKLYYIPFNFGLPGYLLQAILNPILGSFANLVSALAGSKPQYIEIRVHLSKHHRMRRILARLFYWSMFPALILFIFLFFQTEELTARIIIAVLGVAVILAARIADEMYIVPLRIKWLRGSFAAINGAHHEFIADLQAWPLKWEKGQWNVDNAK